MLEIVEELEEIRQSVERILSTRKGEWFLNTEFGLNYDNLLTKQFDRELIELDVREAILQEERIDEVINIDIEHDRQDRKVKIKFVARVQSDILEGEVDI